MHGMINHEKAFVKLFSQTARYHHRFKVFEDFICCSVIALENRLCFSEAREQKYLRIVRGYEKEDVTRMSQLLAHVVNGLGEASGGFLGRVFMQMELGDKYRGQFFPPWDVARMMAAMQLGDTEALFRDKPFITLSEPACGAGCMVLAFADVLRKGGVATAPVSVGLRDRYRSACGRNGIHTAVPVRDCRRSGGRQYPGE